MKEHSVNENQTLTVPDNGNLVKCPKFFK